MRPIDELEQIVKTRIDELMVQKRLHEIVNDRLMSIRPIDELKQIVKHRLDELIVQKRLSEIERNN
jgi:hypothetical protein